MAPACAASSSGVASLRSSCHILKVGIRLEPGQRFGFHNFRHSLATFLVNRGKDVKTIQDLYRAEDFDFRLKAGSAAVDKGVVIPQVTDGYTGAAPDLGALESGQPLPHYGPRDK